MLLISEEPEAAAVNHSSDNESFPKPVPDLKSDRKNEMDLAQNAMELNEVKIGSVATDEGEIEDGEILSDGEIVSDEGDESEGRPSIRVVNLSSILDVEDDPGSPDIMIIEPETAPAEKTNAKGRVSSPTKPIRITFPQPNGKSKASQVARKLAELDAKAEVAAAQASESAVIKSIPSTPQSVPTISSASTMNPKAKSVTLKPKTPNGHLTTEDEVTAIGIVRKVPNPWQNISGLNLGRKASTMHRPLNLTKSISDHTKPTLPPTGQPQLQLHKEEWMVGINHTYTSMQELAKNPLYPSTKKIKKKCKNYLRHVSVHKADLVQSITTGFPETQVTAEEISEKSENRQDQENIKVVENLVNDVWDDTNTEYENCGDVGPGSSIKKTSLDETDSSKSAQNQMEPSKQTEINETHSNTDTDIILDEQLRDLRSSSPSILPLATDTPKPVSETPLDPVPQSLNTTATAANPTTTLTTPIQVSNQAGLNQQVPANTTVVPTNNVQHIGNMPLQSQLIQISSFVAALQSMGINPFLNFTGFPMSNNPVDPGQTSIDSNSTQTLVQNFANFQTQFTNQLLNPQNAGNQQLLNSQNVGNQLLFNAQNAANQQLANLQNVGNQQPSNLQSAGSQQFLFNTHNSVNQLLNSQNCGNSGFSFAQFPNPRLPIIPMQTVSNVDMSQVQLTQNLFLNNYTSTNVPTAITSVAQPISPELRANQHIPIDTPPSVPRIRIRTDILSERHEPEPINTITDAPGDYSNDTSLLQNNTAMLAHKPPEFIQDTVEDIISSDEEDSRNTGEIKTCSSILQSKAKNTIIVKVEPGVKRRISLEKYKKSRSTKSLGVIPKPDAVTSSISAKPDSNGSWKTYDEAQKTVAGTEDQQLTQIGRHSPIQPPIHILTEADIKKEKSSTVWERLGSAVSMSPTKTRSKSPALVKPIKPVRPTASDYFKDEGEDWEALSPIHTVELEIKPRIHRISESRSVRPHRSSIATDRQSSSGSDRRQRSIRDYDKYSSSGSERRHMPILEADRHSSSGSVSRRHVSHRHVDRAVRHRSRSPGQRSNSPSMERRQRSRRDSSGEERPKHCRPHHRSDREDRSNFDAGRRREIKSGNVPEKHLYERSTIVPGKYGDVMPGRGRDAGKYGDVISSRGRVPGKYGDVMPGRGRNAEKYGETLSGRDRVSVKYVNTRSDRARELNSGPTPFFNSEAENWEAETPVVPIVPSSKRSHSSRKRQLSPEPEKRSSRSRPDHDAKRNRYDVLKNRKPITPEPEFIPRPGSSSFFNSEFENWDDQPAANSKTMERDNRPSPDPERADTVRVRIPPPPKRLPKVPTTKVFYVSEAHTQPQPRDHHNKDKGYQPADSEIDDTVVPNLPPARYSKTEWIQDPGTSVPSIDYEEIDDDDGPVVYDYGHGNVTAPVLLKPWRQDLELLYAEESGVYKERNISTPVTSVYY